MDEIIFLRQVLELMKKTDDQGRAVPFDIEFRTFNSNNKTGGALKKYKGARLLIAKKKQAVFNPMEHEYRQFRVRKNPNHWDNRTRNIETPSGQVRKLKILYIDTFNGKKVVY